MNRLELEGLKRIQNYFGEHDKTPFEHWAFSFLDGIIKSIDGGVQEYDKLLRDAYEWWHYLIPSRENIRLMKKYYPNEPTGSPRFFMDTDKLRIYMLENGIEQDEPPTNCTKGMKWVKASERNPDKSGYYFSYGGYFKSYRQTTFWYADEKKWSSETVEWLDESAEDSLQVASK